MVCSPTLMFELLLCPTKTKVPSGRSINAFAESNPEPPKVFNPWKLPEGESLASRISEDPALLKTSPSLLKVFPKTKYSPAFVSIIAFPLSYSEPPIDRSQSKLPLESIFITQTS